METERRRRNGSVARASEVMSILAPADTRRLDLSRNQIHR